MISLELIFPGQGKRMCAHVCEKITVGEFEKKITDFFGIKNGRVLLLSDRKNVSKDMTLKQAGMHTGSGVIMEDGNL